MAFSKQISVAPMLDKTDRHFHYLARLFSPHTALYTEMTTTQALLRNPQRRQWQRGTEQGLVALQLGGSEPHDLAQCSQMAEDMGYGEVNLNVGCPSSRVKAGRFGACLMKQPDLVAECVHSMKSTVNIPVTVKTRIGVDHDDQYEKLYSFVNQVSQAGCQTFVMHARKAWLNGLSPKQNREIPPLRYDVVYQIKKDFPLLSVILNGGIDSTNQIEQVLPHVDGVMIGRAVCRDLCLLQRIEKKLFHNDSKLNQFEILQSYLEYAKQQHSEGVPFSILLRPLYGLFYQTKGAKRWRRLLGQQRAVFDMDVPAMLATL